VYSHFIKNQWGLGADLHFNYVSPLTSTEVPENDYYYFGIAPVIRFSYINKNKLMMYSELAAGLALMLENNKWTVGNIPYFQATFFGISYGKNLYIGGEIGVGFRGFLNLNVGYKF
jgi:hypothetical protein